MSRKYTISQYIITGSNALIIFFINNFIIIPNFIPCLNSTMEFSAVTQFTLQISIKFTFYL